MSMSNQKEIIDKHWTATEIDARVREIEELRQDETQFRLTWREVGELLDIIRQLREPQKESFGFICAKWKRLSDGCVARCDKPHNHEGRCVDSVIDIEWIPDPPKETR